MTNFLKNSNRGVTMIEVLMVVVFIGILAVILLNYFNPLEKRDQATNSKQKSDLDRLAIALEDYYNDKGCYPEEVLCQGATEAAALKPYLGTIPCDPTTGESYYYDPEDTDCPQYYRIYTTFKWDKDPQIAAVGCSWGCGPADAAGVGFPFNYGVSSPNVKLENAGYFCSRESGTGRRWNACQNDRCDAVGYTGDPRVETCCPNPGKQCPESYTGDKCYCNEEPFCLGECK